MICLRGAIFSRQPSPFCPPKRAAQVDDHDRSPAASLQAASDTYARVRVALRANVAGHPVLHPPTHVDMPASEEEWSAGAVSRAVSSSLASLSLTLPSVSPIPAAPDAAKANLKYDDLRQASNVPNARPPSSSRRPRKNWSFPAWYRVGGDNKQLVLSPHRPRCARV